MRCKPSPGEVVCSHPDELGRPRNGLQDIGPRPAADFGERREIKPQQRQQCEAAQEEPGACCEPTLACKREDPLPQLAMQQRDRQEDQQEQHEETGLEKGRACEDGKEEGCREARCECPQP
jgi:hypothetical protein